MPLPLLIPIIIGAGGTLLGIGKGAKAVKDSNKANDINQTAKQMIEKAKFRLDASRKRTTKALESLGRKKIHVLEVPVARFVDLFGMLKNVKLKKSAGLDELGKLHLDKAEFKQLKEMSQMASSMAGGILGGTVAGGVAAFGAYGAATTFAAASTGTAISTLSGAAATNATLAFLGGGTLAAGGLGVAGGMMVLGGLVAGPALAVLGIVTGAKAAANLEKARSNLAEAKKIEAKLSVLRTASDAIGQRASLFEEALERLENLMNPLLDNLKSIIMEEGTNWGRLSEDSQKSIAILVATMQSTKALLDTPILDAQGGLSKDSGEILGLIDKQQS